MVWGKIQGKWMYLGKWFCCQCPTTCKEDACTWLELAKTVSVQWAVLQISQLPVMFLFLVFLWKLNSDSFFLDHNITFTSSVATPQKEEYILYIIYAVFIYVCMYIQREVNLSHSNFKFSLLKSSIRNVRLDA